MTADERLVSLEDQLKRALERVQLLEEQLAAAQKRIEELEKQKTPPPAFAKANVQKKASGEKQPRKKRAAQHNHGRRREAPTQIVEHRIGSCPVCASRLGGVSIARRRQVIEIPPPPPVEVREHVIYHGWCSECQHWREAPLDVSAEVLGQGRLGMKITSLIAYLRTVMRLPLRQIQTYLATLHGLKISVGELAEFLHRLTEKLEPTLAGLKAAIRASPAVQADETGWREDGSNGYIWSASTPTVRYYEYHHSRGHEVVEALLGPDFQGVLGSDFYAAYNVYTGLHQRCWVHLLRDRHELKEQHPEHAEVQQWAKDVKAVYDWAVAYAGPDPSLPPAKQEAARRKQQRALEQELWQLCAPYAHTASPLQTLCHRVERFLPELFVFVARPEVPADNNQAERDLRMVKVQQKIAGTFRSQDGATAFCRIRSYLSTMRKQGHAMLPALAAVFAGHPLPIAWVPK